MSTGFLPLALLTVLTNGPFSVPPSAWRAVEVQVPAPGTQVEVEFEVQKGSRVQVLLLTPEEANRFHRGRSFIPLCGSGFQTEARMRCRVEEAGPHVLMIDNRIEGRAPTELHLRVDLRAPVNVVVRELPPERRRLVIALSLGFFGIVVLYSAREFLRRN